MRDNVIYCVVLIYHIINCYSLGFHYFCMYSYVYMYVFYVFLYKELLVTLSYFPLDYNIGSVASSYGPRHAEAYINANSTRHT
jgi:hypothetical protein